MTDYRVNHLDGVAVSNDYYWRPIHTCPLNVKVLLLSNGVAVMGEHYMSGKFSHWAPLPRVPKEVTSS